MDYMTGFHCKYIEDAERIARKLNPTDYRISKSTDKEFPHYATLYFSSIRPNGKEWFNRQWKSEAF